MSISKIKDLLSNQSRLGSQRPAHDEIHVSATVAYLESGEAAKSMELNSYWPKWNSPWWHMSVLFEMGLSDRIPKVAAEKMLSEIKRTHLPYFFREEAPSNKASHQDAPCPCALGNIYQILSAVGLDVDAALPWARGWFLKYQMSDGGLSCDEDAYKADPNASSLVGTIAPLEAILTASQKLTPAEEQFLDRGAKCLIDRELRLGSSSKFNAEERLDEADWLKPCFPRFYLYDVMRGLRFILRWAKVRRKPIPAQSIFTVVIHLCKQFPDGQIKIERTSFDGIGTLTFTPSGETVRGQSASFFPLLDSVSPVGQISPYLSSQWNEISLILEQLIEEGLVE